MDAQSPPKRMTRSRAAAKADSSSVKTTKIVTAAVKAKATRSAASSSTTTKATKRKTRADDVDDDELQDNDDAASLPAVATTITRGRVKKTGDGPAPEPAPEPAPKPRGRPKKTADTVQDEPVKAPRVTRARKTKLEDQPEAVSQPVKKTTRGRALPSTATKPALKTAMKKTVSFEEPEKENIAPKATTKSTKGKTSTGEVAEAPATGLRAKPVRRIASATTRATRATRANPASSGSKEPRPSPLSPKKVTQMSLNKADSDDELATSEKTPLKPMAKAPTKQFVLPSKPLEVGPSSTAEENTTVVNSSELAASLLLGTPAKRMPASPWKDSMASPARKVDVLPPLPHSVARSGVQANELHLKASLLQSPAKRPPSSVQGLEKRAVGALELGASPFKTSLLFSPAKRPLSPMKFPSNKSQDDYDFNALGTPAPKSVLLSTPVPAKQDTGSEELQLVEQAELLDGSLSSYQVEFPGRLSSVLPRHADPSMESIGLPLPQMQEESGDVEEADAQAETEADAEADGEEESDDEVGDAMILDEPVTILYNPSPSKLNGPMYRLRDTHANDDDSDSEDELASSSRDGPRAMFGAAPSTPSLPIAEGRTNGASQARSTSKRLRLDAKFGFTPLAQQLSSWNTASPLQTGTCAKSPSPEPTTATEQAADVPVLTPSQGTFFDDEMVTRAEAEETVDAETREIEEPIFDDMPVTDEDVALAAEAHEMSLLEPDQIEHLVNDNVVPDDSVSEASQEYGDENEVPIDPKLLHGIVPAVTPQRFIRREFHTVSKVPLKAADESTPRPRIKKRSRSMARLPVQRPTKALTRNATVISYSPTKNGHDMEETPNQRAESAPPVTPSKAEAGWSTAGTPARTPRRDLKPNLLRGAVVHVDVHTSEGADASGIFMELLAQMGARCVKNWPWNPSSPPGPAGASSKVGITHVVYKDGGKRTLEKVRETGGVVQCVGVSWVLDCERENQWLDEAPYYIDTSLVPRGGARRRRSMEPKALANLNGMLVATPLRSASAGAQRECHTAPTTPANSRRARRESGLWELTPEDPNDETSCHDGEDYDGSAWGHTILTPVPKTPAPEAIARYVNTVSPETPIEDDEDERIRMIMRTCPPKPNEFRELGESVLGQKKDEGVLMRLMAARRKSLQFAPKVGSPLARAWK